MESILDFEAIKSEPNGTYPHYNKGVNFIQDELNTLKFEIPKECVEITLDDIRSSSSEDENQEENERLLEQQAANSNKTDECSSEDVQESNDDNANNNHCDQFNTVTNLNMGETVIFNDPNPTKYIKSCSQNRTVTKTGGILRMIAPNEYIVTKDGKYQCAYCKFTSTAKRGKNIITVHIRGCHHKESPMYQCPHCPYKSFHGLRSHLLYKHTNDEDIQWYQCDKCNMKYKTKHALKKHLYSHFSSEELQTIEKHQCPICGSVFRRKDKIKRHIDSVHNKKKLYCESCNFSTSTMYSLKYHVQVKHSESKDLQTHCCQHCSYKTNFVARLKAHVKIQHTNSEIICEMCGYKGRTPMKMKLHQITHQKKIDEKELKYQCNKCNYKTYRPYSLTVHKLNHLKSSEIKYFYCHHCDFKAKRKDNLKTHILRHFKKEEVTLWCYLCDFSTKRRVLLSEHLSMKHKKETRKT